MGAFDLPIRATVAIPEWPIRPAEWNDQDQSGMAGIAQILFFLRNSEEIPDLWKDKSNAPNLENCIASSRNLVVSH